MTFRKPWTLMLAASGLALTSSAHAAETAQSAQDTAPADSAAATAADNSGLTEIVVTATKRETNLQKTPISISVIGADIVEKRHVQSLMDLANGGVPSLRVATFEARQSALTVGIRGIVPFDQNQVAREPGVGVYIDGVYLGRSQGLNAALSIVTKAPTGAFGGRPDTGRELCLYRCGSAGDAEPAGGSAVRHPLSGVHGLHARERGIGLVRL